ncbi:MAG TPA: glutathione S-transferase family protein [Gammaproteobacteria bacterium]
MKTPELELVSHHLCPYVQRTAIALLENDVRFRRRYVDLAAKPDWFVKLSPLGKVPLLVVGGKTVLFESAAIAEFVNDVNGGSLLSRDPLERSRQRAWIEFASNVIGDIGRLYTAHSDGAYAQARGVLDDRWRTLEPNLGGGPYFAGREFSLVDAAFGPMFRYFEVIDPLTETNSFEKYDRVNAWRDALSARPSVRSAVMSDYPERLKTFLAGKSSVVGAAARGENSGPRRAADRSTGTR